MSRWVEASRFLRTPLLILLLGLVVSGCGINNIPTFDEQAKAKWSDVQNEYQRRADLIPNLVETVKGYANQEREVLTQVIEARAKATQDQGRRVHRHGPCQIQRIPGRTECADGRARAIAGDGRTLLPI